MSEPLRLILSAPPAVEPVTLAEAKAFLRVDIGNDDALITALTGTARDACERFTGHALVAQTWTLFLDDWPGKAVIKIPRPPLLSIAHVKTYDDTDTATLWPASNYFADTASDPGRLIARSGAVLPEATRPAAGIEIRFVAGYPPDDSGSPSDPVGNIPGSLIEGIRRLVAYLYENRGECGTDEAAALSGATLLWRPYRMMRI